MITITKYPKKELWSSFTKRPTTKQKELDNAVNEIISNVKKHKDVALLNYTKKWDCADINNLKVSKKELEQAQISSELEKAIKVAKSNIEKFHKSQIIEEKVVETAKGVRCWRKNVAIEKVGLYIPGGTAPLFSTVLMLGIPAKLVGCKEIVLCTPPSKNGDIHPAILYTAKLIGIHQIFKVGGAQSIAAMAFGTETIPKVYKIFGPGNQYVTKAKEIVQQSGVAIDMPAGPSEVLVIADKYANPTFVASDLLSQAEHGTDSQVIVLSNNLVVLEKINAELKIQLSQLPRKEFAEKSLQNSKSILLESLEDCMDFSNEYAPEHLIINVKDSEKYSRKITNAGSVFLGAYSCESAGDYASGTNHTLPTNGYAKNYSGVSVDSFVKKITFQKLSAEGLKNIGNAIEIMAEAEELIAHKNAVSLRLKSL